MKTAFTLVIQFVVLYALLGWPWFYEHLVIGAIVATLILEALQRLLVLLWTRAGKGAIAKSHDSDKG